MGFLIGMTIAGGLVGLASELWNTYQGTRQLENELNYLNTEKENRENELARDFALQKQEAQRTAKQQDLETTQGEKTLSTNANLALSQVSLQNLQFGEQLSSEDMALGQQYGSQLSSLSQSGTRNSSMNQAVEMQNAVSRAQIDSAVDTNRKSTELSLKNILGDFGNGLFQVQTARDNANYLRNSYEAGGTAHQAMLNAKQSIQEDYNLQINKLTDEANAWSEGTGIRLLNSLFGGANTGLQLGYNLQSLSDKSGWSLNNNKQASFNDLGTSRYSNWAHPGY